jgi:hypothetical protein
MCNLTDIEKSQLRGKYEKLNSVCQGGLPSMDRTLQTLTTQELMKIFEDNESDSQKWPTFTQLEDHIRNIAQLKRYGVPVSI